MLPLFLPTLPLPLFPVTPSSRCRHLPRMVVPASVRTSDVLVVGGGPTGSVAAAYLHQLQIPTSLIEQEHDFTSFDVTRAYCLRLDFRASRVLQSVDALLPFAAARLQSTSGFAVSRLFADGRADRRQFPRIQHDVPDLCDLRPAVVDSLKQFVCALPLDASYGAEVVDIAVADDGEIAVTLRAQGLLSVRRTRLLLACDGRNSRVARLLDAAHARGDPVHAPHGLGVDTFDSPAVGLALKSIVLDDAVVDHLLGPRKEGSFTVRQLVGDTKRPFDDMFRISIFPAGPGYTRRLGGFLGSIVRQSAHNIWKLADVDAAYDFFQANFPQMDARKAISEPEMRRFLDAKPSHLRDIRRRKSLAVRTGNPDRGGEGAVVFLGDSAHAFPPDIGQGVSAAIGDVGAFVEVVLGAGENDTLSDVTQRYDDARSSEARALMKLSKFGSPYQYGVYTVPQTFWMLNLLLRKVLSQLLPGIMWPQMTVMLGEDLTYEEIVRRGDVTTARLWAGAAVIVLPVLAMAMRSMM